MAPSIEDKRQIAIPSRSSSTSHTSGTTKRNKQHSTVNHNYFDEHAHQIDAPQTGHSTPIVFKARARDTQRRSAPPTTDRRSNSCSAMTRNTTRATKVQHWAGLTRSVRNWDGLRKDPELWVENADCHVHLYARGASRRGPSFCVPSRALRQKHCNAMLESCYAQSSSESATGSDAARRIRSFDNMNRGSAVIEIYIPAPENASREQSFNWHLTTRNFFAFVLGQPLVGHHMGQTFVHLLERMKKFRAVTVDNHKDFLEYAENQGYRDLVECTDYALASLYYAEKYKLRDCWIDAFAHCVGMNDSLSSSPEYTSISKLSKALITRAHLEVEMHLTRVAKALRNFLQDDMSPAYLGLADAARNHLQSFQQFLHQFYTDKFGYWPPPSTASPFPKALYRSMFYDFKNLYDLLVDTQSNNDISLQRPASGGICVLQNVDQFNKRHKFTAQLHPLPLLPSKPQPQRTARSLSSSSRHKKTHDNHFKSAALAIATNSLGADSTNSKIVQAYLEFERNYAANSSQRVDKLTSVDARKVRWLVIYGTLQYLTSALRCPQEVRDTESADYPLCCLIAGRSSWNAGTPMPTPPIPTPLKTPKDTDDYFGGAHSQETEFSIQPDCHREDYFTSQSTNRHSAIELTAPVKVQAPSRQPSLRAFGALSSLSARSSRRNSLVMKPPSHCPIIVHGYGDGLNQTSPPSLSAGSTGHDRTQGSARTSTSCLPEQESVEDAWLNPSAPPAPACETTTNREGRSHQRTRTPLLHTFQLEITQHPPQAEEANEPMCRSDSTSSTGSSIFTDAASAASSKSSATGDRRISYKASTAEHSGLLGGLVSVDGTRVSLDSAGTGPSSPRLSQGYIHPLLRKNNVEPAEFQFGFDSNPQDSVVAEAIVETAFSTPPSPPLRPTLPPRITSMVRTMSFKTEKASSTPQIISVDEKIPSHNAARKKNRSSDIFSAIVTTPSDLRDRYTTAIKRLEVSSSHSQHVNSYNDARTVAHPPTVTKTSHANKGPSLRNRIWSDDIKDGKKEKRMSAIWRR